MQGHCKLEGLGGPRGAKIGCQKAKSQKRGGIESEFKQLNEKLQEEETKCQSRHTVRGAWWRAGGEAGGDLSEEGRGAVISRGRGRLGRVGRGDDAVDVRHGVGLEVGGGSG